MESEVYISVVAGEAGWKGPGLLFACVGPIF